MSHHQDKMTEMLTRYAATYIALEANRDTLITPIHSTISEQGTRATVYVTVFPDAKIEVALAFLNRHSDDFRDYLKEKARFSHLPFVNFALDDGERNRQHLDDISRGL